MLDDCFCLTYLNYFGIEVSKIDAESCDRNHYFKLKKASWIKKDKNDSNKAMQFFCRIIFDKILKFMCEYGKYIFKSQKTFLLILIW